MVVVRGAANDLLTPTHVRGAGIEDAKRQEDGEEGNQGQQTSEAAESRHGTKFEAMYPHTFDMRTTEADRSRQDLNWLCSAAIGKMKGGEERKRGIGQINCLRAKRLALVYGIVSFMGRAY